MPFEQINRAMNKRAISATINLCYRKIGLKETVVFADQLMYTGFYYATRAGVSFGVNDMVVPKEKEAILEAAESEVKDIQDQYAAGLVTDGERYNKVVDIWSRTNDQVAKAMMEKLGVEPVTEGPGKGGQQESFNSIYMMADSGARGSAAQIRQLAGMRGLMAKPDGSIIETPITANFREGLDVLQYFISTHGARKGLADTALKTANSGYLTRRLVDVAQDLVVTELDCGTTQGLLMTPLVEGGDIVEPLRERVLGRAAAVDVLAPGSDKVVLEAGTLLDESAVKTARSVLDRSGARALADHLRDEVRRVRAVLRPRLGARSSREPRRGRRRHRGAVDRRARHAAHDAYVPHRRRGVALRRRQQRRGEEHGHDPLHQREDRDARAEGPPDHDVALRRARRDRRVRPRARALQGAVRRVARRQGRRGRAAGPARRELGSAHASGRHGGQSGYLKFEDFIDGVTVTSQVDEITGLTSIVVLDAAQRSSDYRPTAKLVDSHGKAITFPNTDIPAAYALPSGAVLSMENGARVMVGDVLARLPQESSKTRDITGGLPRVADLFEARRPKDPAILAEYSGTVSFGKETKGKRRLVITDEARRPKDPAILASIGHGQLRQGDQRQAPARHYRRGGRGARGADSEVAPLERVRGRKGAARRDHRRRRAEPARHPAAAGRRAAGRLPRARDPGRLPPPGREDQRQAHRGHHSPDAAQGRDHGHGRYAAPARRADRPAPRRRGEPRSRDQERQRRPTVDPVLLGITKASLATESFISAASFQETTRVLTEAAVRGLRDDLRGLKENVIVGRLIPAGTGYAHHEDRRRTQEEILAAELKELDVQQQLRAEAAAVAAAGQASEEIAGGVVTKKHLG